MSSIVDQLAHQIALVRLPARRIAALWGGRWVLTFYPPDWNAGPSATLMNARKTLAETAS